MQSGIGRKQRREAEETQNDLQRQQLLAIAQQCEALATSVELISRRRTSCRLSGD